MERAREDDEEKVRAAERLADAIEAGMPTTLVIDDRVVALLERLTVATEKHTALVEARDFEPVVPPGGRGPLGGASEEMEDVLAYLESCIVAHRHNGTEHPPPHPAGASPRDGEAVGAAVVAGPLPQLRAPRPRRPQVR